MDVSLYFQKLKIFSFYSLIFILPLFFIPILNLNFNLQKQSFFTLFTLLFFIGWWAENIFLEKITLRKNKIFYTFLFLSIFFLIFSSLFSSSRSFSFLPSLQNILDNFLTLFFLFFFLFLVSAISFDKKTIFLVLFLFSLSFAILNFLLFVNILFKKNIFPAIFQPLEVSILSAIFLPFYSLLVFRAKGWLKIFFIFSLFLILFNLNLFNFKPAFLIIIFQLIFLVFFLVGKEKKEGFLLYFSLFLLLTLSFFLYFFPSFIFSDLPFYLSFPFLAQVDLVISTFKEGAKEILLGSGPGTFLFQFLNKKPLFLNQTIFWGTKLNEGFSFFFDSLITKGLLFSFSFLVLALLPCFYFLKRIFQKKESVEEIFLFSSFLGSLICVLFLPTNFLLIFIFFLFLGILFSLFSIPEDFIISKSKYFIFNILFIFFIFLFSFYIFIQGKILIGEFFYQKGFSFFQKGDIDKTIEYLQKATKINERSDLYFRDLSQAYFFKLLSLANKQDVRDVQILIFNSSEAIERAIKISPQNSSNWNLKGFIFRNLLDLPQAAQIALQSYQKASQVEPNSPFPYGEMGRVYILIAQKLEKEGKEEERRENLKVAKEKLKKAIELKSDYAPAFYLLAVASDQEGNLDEAISFLERAFSLNPESYIFNLHLGKLYWKKGKENLDKALLPFEKAISLNPNSIDAYFMKGVVFFQKGEKEKAILEFEKASKINPDEPRIKEIIEKLRKGESIDDILQIEENVAS